MGDEHMQALHPIRHAARTDPVDLNDIAELVYAKRYANPLPINLCDDLDAAISSLGEVQWK